MVTLQNISLHFGERTLFNDVSFFVSKKDRIGLVGKNGAGKSTLLKIIIGEMKANNGDIIIPKECTLGYLPQEMNHREDLTIFEEASQAFAELNTLEERIESITKEITERTDYESDEYNNLIELLSDANDRLSILGGSNMEEQVQKILMGLGFKREDMNRQMNEFSGGWKMRVELSKLLLQSPSVLLLDEPTNHLDIESIEWLESFLKNYPGAIILISHDKTFLDTLCNRTIEITSNGIFDFKAPYSKYIVWRQEETERQLVAYKNQQKYIQDTQILINKFRAKKNKAAFAQTLIRKLEKLEIIELDSAERNEMRIAFPPAPRSGKVILEAKDLKKSYGEKEVFSNLELIVARQEKLAIVGKNGAGKTTLTKIITGSESFDGKFEIGHNVDIGYYAQNQTDFLDPNQTVFDIVDNEAKGDIRNNLRGILGAFLFSGEDIDKKVKVLSGGEKARLALCKLLLHPYNVLILDEPTNHLDIMSKSVLKQALQNFDGTLIIVSHDRDFLSGLTEFVYEVTPSGLKQYIGDITGFLSEKRAVSIAAFEATKKKKTVVKEEKNSAQKWDYKQRKEREREKRRLSNLITKSEKEISEAEEKLEELNKIMAELDYSDQNKMAEELKKYDECKKKLDVTMATWEDAQIKLDEMIAED